MPTRGHIVSLACKKVYHLPACLICLITIGIQAYIVNYYLATYYDKSWYSWYAADILAVILFIAAYVDSYRHMKNRNGPTNLFGGKIGHLPLVYLSWLFYSLCLAVRIGIIFRYIAPGLTESLMFGPNMLKTGVSLSSIIFFLLVIGHVEAEPKSIIDNYVTGIVGRVTIDVLDSVQFLELLFISESHIFLTFQMHNAIIAIGCINLILPTFKLAILSMGNFGTNKMSKLLETLYIVSDLIIVNVPLLVVRILLWHVHSQDVSVFIIKNVLSLCMTVKAIHDHCVDINGDDEEDGEGGAGAQEQAMIPLQKLPPSDHKVDEEENKEEKQHLQAEDPTAHKFV